MTVECGTLAVVKTEDTANKKIKQSNDLSSHVSCVVIIHCHTVITVTSFKFRSHLKQLQLISSCI